MKQCPKCKTSISETAKLCPKCGCNIGGDMHTEDGSADIFNDDWLGEIESSTNSAVAQKQAAEIRQQTEQTFAAYKYEKHTDGTYTITGLKDKTALRYSVPQGVVSIADGAFAGSKAVKVTLPDGILQIGDGAFKGCANLSSINLPESLMIVGDEAFAECEMLDITLPPSVRKVGKDAVKNTVQDKKRQAAEAKRKAEEEARRRAEAEAKRKAEEETRRRAEAEAKRKAEEEARRRAEAEAKRKAEEETRRRAETEAKRKAEEEARRRAEAEAKRKAEEETRRRAEAEAKRKAKAEERRRADAEAMRKVEEIKRKLGDFGSYKQWGNKKEPIEWLVLAIEDNKVLLISKYALDCKKYRRNMRKCSLRKWLNGKFLRTAFNRTERTKILSPRVSMSDKIFLLSTEEAEEYFPSDAARRCEATAYAQNKGIYVGEGCCNWWLRTFGITEFTSAYVSTYGWVNETGENPAISRYICIRPALWVRLDP